MKQFKLTVIAVAICAATPCAARLESQPPPPVVSEPERHAKIVDQLERLVSRPNRIVLSASQRRAIDNLKISYLKETLAGEREPVKRNPMESVMKFRERQLKYYHSIEKLMGPSQMPDFEANVDAASRRQG